jgi:hypothetical protein
MIGEFGLLFGAILRTAADFHAAVFALAFARLDDLFLLIPNSARSEGLFAAIKALPRCLGDGGLVPG